MKRDDNRHIFVVDFSYEVDENENTIRTIWKSIFEKINTYGLKKGRGLFDTTPPILKNRDTKKYSLIAEAKGVDCVGYNRRLF